MNKKTVYTNGYIFDNCERNFKTGSVFVENGMITDVDYSGKAITDDNTFDLNGAYLIPGLVDIHTHGRAGSDFTGASESDIRKMIKSYAEVGTTSVMATFASASMDDYYKSIDAVNSIRNAQNNDVFGAFILGMHLEGRYINPSRRGAHALSLLAPLNPDELSELIHRMQPLPTHVSAAPELDGGEAFVKKTRELGATFSIGHTDATDAEARNAISWGASSFTHTYNAMRPIHHREPGVIGAALMCDNAYTEVICDGEHVHPNMVALLSKNKPKDKVILITDSMEAAGCADGEYGIAGTKVFVKNGRAVNEEGALAGSTLDLFTAVKNYCRFTGVSFGEALICATSNPAQMLGVADKVGSIKIGCNADFIIINDIDNPKIENVILRNTFIK